MTDPNNKEKEKQQPFAAAPISPPKSPEQAKEPGESTVTMVFPRAVRLTTRTGPVDFKAGINEVPEHLADEPWLKHNGVKRQGAKGAEPPKGSWEEAAAELPRTVPASMTQHHVDFLQSRGYHVDDPAGAQTFFERLNPNQREGFLKDASEWTGTGTSQYELQRRVQDRDAGATEPAPANQKNANEGPQPATVTDLVAEGSAVGTQQQRAPGTQAKPQQGKPQQTQGRDLEFERAHPGSFNPGMEVPKPQGGTGQVSTGQVSTAGPGQQGKPQQAQTTSSAKPPENK